MNPRFRALTLTLLACCAWLSLTGAAHGLTTNGVAVQEFADGFQTQSSDRGSFGPLGVAVDHTNRVFVAEHPRSSIFRFGGPGSASSSTRLGDALGGGTTGLAIDGRGRMFVARRVAGDILEVNPDNGEIVRTVVDDLCGPVGLAADPVSGDLFVTESSCDTGLLRVLNVSAANPKVVKFAGGFGHADGIAIGPDGTIYVADENAPEANIGGAVIRISGTGSENPGARTLITPLSQADGIVVAAAANGQPTPFLLVSRNNGTLTKVDLTTNPPTLSDLITGSDRGEDTAVGADGCLYASQLNRVIKVTNADGSCNVPGGLGVLAPTAPPKETGGEPAANLPSNSGCVDKRKFTFRLHHGPTTTVVGVDIFVNGRRRVHQRGDNIETVTLRRLPLNKTFRVRIVSTHSNGSKLISRRKYVGCEKTAPKTRRKGKRRGGRRGGGR